MFAQPKPILPGVEDEELSKASDESSPVKAITEGAVSDDTAKKSSTDKNSTGSKTVTPQPPVAMVHPMAPAPKIETAWERGLRQAKEMKRRSQQRKVNYADLKVVCVNLFTENYHNIFGLHNFSNYRRQMLNTKKSELICLLHKQS